ncbi:LuxR family transcriptional regulator [Geodermatophilus marinus]|nr:LuxR family transcriptional regulator [Geodermatophilus sp. LHW52908]
MDRTALDRTALDDTALDDTALDGMALALRLATAASSAATPETAAGDVLGELCGLPEVVAAALATREPLSGRSTALACSGYPAPVLAHLTGPGFLVADVGYRLLVTDPGRRARGWRDVDGYTATPSVREVFSPAGYCGGATARLVTTDGRWTGDLHVSTTTDGAPGPDVVAAMHHAAPALAAAVDATRRFSALAAALAPDEAASVVTPDGRLVPLPGRPPLLPDDPALLAAVVSRRGEGAWCWHGPAGWTRIRLVAVAGGILVVGRPCDPPHGLSARELEVLTLLAEGLSNHALARRLGISERTAAHHVEHVLAKCGAPSRAAAAVRAVQEGWRLLPGR